MRLSTTQQIVIGCAAALFILVLLSEIAYRTARRAGESGESATRAQSVLLFAESLSGQLDNADRALREMTESGDFEATEAYRTATSRILENLELLHAYASPDLPHLARFTAIDSLAGQKLSSNGSLLDSREPEPDALRAALEASELLSGRLYTEIQQLRRAELEFLATESVAESLEAQRTKYSILLVSVGAFVFLTVGASFMIGDLEGRKRAERNLHASERRFRTLAASAPIGIFLARPDGELDFVNDRYTAITGVTMESVSGRIWAEGLHPDDRDVALEEWQVAAASGRDFQSEYRSIKPDGRVVWIHGRSAALRDDDGSLAGFVGTVSDITDRKLAEAERDRFFDLSPDMLSIRDFHGNLRSFNPAWSNTLGFNVEELISGSLIDFVHPDDLKATENEWTRLMRGGAVRRFENRFRTRSGGYRWLSWNAAADMDHKLVYEIARDVTASRELQERLNEKNEELERQNIEVARATRLKSEFLANMSHELRTPLNGIIGFAELIRDGHAGPVTDTHEEFLDDILMSSRHLLGLINDILDLSKVEAGKITFRPERVGLASIVGEVQQTVRELAAKAQVALSLDLDPAIGEVELDPVRLKQVLYNYISNALKFTEAGGRVVVRATLMSEGMFRLDVEDTGIGIRSEDLGKLFSEFQQLDGGTSKRYQGTGLGLALTRRIVEAQGGSVGVRSRWGEGSTFYAILPLRVVPEDEGAAPSDPAASTARRPRLLVIEGTREAADTIVDELRRHSLDVRLVARGIEAMELAAAENFDGIILDLHLPDMDGAELLRAIRACDLHVSTPVVAVTSPADARRAPQLQVQGFVEKPVDPGQLIESLRRAGFPVRHEEGSPVAGAETGQRI